MTQIFGTEKSHIEVVVVLTFLWILLSCLLSEIFLFTSLMFLFSVTGFLKLFLAVSTFCHCFGVEMRGFRGRDKERHCYRT